jgi:hypothetical protein
MEFPCFLLNEEKKLMEEQMNQKVSALEQMFQSQMNELMKKLAKKRGGQF